MENHGSAAPPPVTDPCTTGEGAGIGTGGGEGCGPLQTVRLVPHGGTDLRMGQLPLTNSTRQGTFVVRTMSGERGRGGEAGTAERAERAERAEGWGGVGVVGQRRRLRAAAP